MLDAHISQVGDARGSGGTREAGKGKAKWARVEVRDWEGGGKARKGAEGRRMEVLRGEETKGEEGWGESG